MDQYHLYEGCFRRSGLRGGCTVLTLQSATRVVVVSDPKRRGAIQ